MKLLIKQASLIFVLLISSSAVAQTVSPALLEQLKNMPRAQQESLARMYGIDLNNLAQLGNQRSRLAQPGESLTQITDESSLVKVPFVTPSERKKGNEEPLPRYGQHLFDRYMAQFAPTDDAQVPEDYRLGVGDELVVQLFGKQNEELLLQVNRDGQISIPKLPPVTVTGLPFIEASQLIKERIQEQLIGVNAAVSMGGLRAINVFMAGEVKVPGAYSMNALTTISQALFQAGGISDIGSMRSVHVKRQGKIIAEFDLYDLLMRGDASNDIRLRSGDVVFVPTYTALVRVAGEVKRPMAYELVNGETISDALAMAGGFTPLALSDNVVLTQRGNKTSLPNVINIDTDNKQMLTKVLRDGDEIRVNKLSDMLENAVMLEGAVVREGAYGWQAGMRVSDLISDIRRDLTEFVDLNYAIVVRETQPEMHLQVLQFSPIEMLLSPQSDENIVLASRDRVIFFDYVMLEQQDDMTLEEELAKKERQQREYQMLWSRTQNEYSNNQNIQNIQNNQGTEPSSVSPLHSSTDLSHESLVQSSSRASERDSLPWYYDEVEEDPSYDRETLLEPILKRLKAQADASNQVKVVSISGAVKAPGEYPLPQSGTLRDLIEAAGGLKDSAFLNSVELRRLTSNINGDVDVQYRDLNITTTAQQNSITLQSRDHVNVRVNDDWNPTDSILITGEVRFPGTYLIHPGETLADVVLRAGGLNRESFPQGAVFTRLEIARMENIRAEEFADSVRRDFASSLLTEEQVNTTYEDIALITQKLETFEGQGRLLINLPRALNGDNVANIEVMDGDTLHIPKRSNTVTIVGEVRRQGTHTYQQGLKLDDYLALGAGLTGRADEAAIYIVKADGSVVIPQTSLTSFASTAEYLSPGDTIIVPVDSQHKESISLWRDITQIIYQGTVAIAAVARL